MSAVPHRAKRILRARRLPAAWVGAWLTATTLAAQDGRIGGLAVSAQSGEPLVGVEVSLGGTTSDESGKTRLASTRTGFGGRFLLTDLPVGEYVLGFRKTGYEAGVRVSRTAVLEQEGDKVELNVELRRSAAVSGRILDPDGDPVANATVTVSEWDTTRGRRTLRNVKQARSDEQGEYRIYGLAPAPYRLGVSPIQLPGPPGVLAYELASQFHPGAPDAESAGPLPLHWGDEITGIDFRLEWSDRTAIEGLALDDAGQPCADCTVAVLSEGDRMVGIVTTTKLGLFAVRGAPVGEYTLLANRRRLGLSGYEPIFLSAGRPASVTVQLGPGQTVSGRVVIEGDVRGTGGPETAPAGSATEGGGLGITTRRSTVRLSNRLFNFSRRRDPVATVDQAVGGAFEIEGVMPGRYGISVSDPPEGAYLDAVLIAGRPLASSELQVAPGVPLSDVEIRLRADGGTVAGEVVGVVRSEGRGPPGVVVLLPDDYGPNRWERLGSYRPSDGLFEIPGVPPGSYRVFAVPRENHFDLARDEDRDYLRRNGRRVSVRPGQSVRAQAPFVPNR